MLIAGKKRIFNFFLKKKEKGNAHKTIPILKKFFNDEQYDFRGYRDIGLNEILNYANKHCPYYRKLFQEYDFNIQTLKNFGSLPLLDKKLVRKNKEIIISDELDRLRFYKMNTGGSTGEPLSFPVSCLAHYNIEVHQRLFYENIGYRGAGRIVSIGGIEIPRANLDKNKFWVKKYKRELPWGKIIFSSAYLSKKNAPFFVKDIMAFRPSIVRGYPFAIDTIAEQILKSSGICDSAIKGVVLTSENATKDQIERIERAFNAPVFLEYGQSEMTVMGYSQNKSYTYKCSPLFGYTEVLNDEGEHVKPGEIGEIVNTGFHNFALPFIRYRSGDMALYNGEKDGVVCLGKIVGRTQDIIYAKNGEKVSLTALIFGRHYKAFNGISRWQLVQKERGKIDVRIVKGENFRDESMSEIRRNFHDVCDVDVNFTFIEEVALTARGKYKFLIQNTQERD